MNTCIFYPRERRIVYVEEWKSLFDTVDVAISELPIFEYSSLILEQFIIQMFCYSELPRINLERNAYTCNGSGKYLRIIYFIEKFMKILILMKARVGHNRLNINFCRWGNLFEDDGIKKISKFRIQPCFRFLQKSNI